ncbi:MAG: signal peptide peptidase SppA [Acidobacteria bacterium]|nr:signal peptide peptidase SppA [Acidobacteriota bacterium]MCA1643085.1 signal peptide peptidase SppA [Acidobacteriota bacterium]
MAMSRTGKTFLWIAGVVLALALVLAAFFALIYSALNNEPDVKNNSVLVLKIGGSLPDYVVEDPVNRFLGRDERSLSGLLLQLRKAKTDRRVGAVLLDIDMITSGWGKAEEVRGALADFRASGKPVYAFMEYGANKDYYVATACDRIYVAPIGELAIIGLAADVMSVRGSLDKLGIYPDFYQIGKYKSAPEEYTQKKMTDAHREALDSLLDDFFARYVSTVAAARRKSETDVRAAIDSAPLRASDAKQLGLIDDAKYRDEVEGDLKKRLGYKDDDKLNLLSEGQYRRVTPESLKLNEGERVAIIYASGAIVSGGSSGGGPFGEQMVGSDTVSKALRDAGDDKTVKAIVLRVDSPGGTSFASDIIWHAVVAAKQKKPVVVSMGDVAASGGYYVSVGASRIVAEPSTVTGSIGVFAGKPVMKGFYDWIGVNDEYVTRGKYAAMWRETEKFTDDERKKFEGMLNNFYWNDFLPKVAEGRKKDVKDVDSLAQGRVWTGTQARERGLVDEFGGLDRAVEVAKQLAGIPADKGVRRVVFPAPRTILDNLFGTGGGEATVEVKQRNAALEALPEDVRRALRYLSVFAHVRRGETMAMLPYDLRIK